MILIIISLLVKCQRVMIDSRTSFINQAYLDQFQQNFSIWISYNNTSNIKTLNFSQIINGNQLLLSLSIQYDKILIKTDDKVIEIQSKQIQDRNIWQHIIINQNKNFQNNQFFINFEYPLRMVQKIELMNFKILENQSIISVDSSLYYYCLVYDQVSDQILPNVQSTNMQNLIQPHYLGENLYYSDSYFEVFIKKYMSLNQNMDIFDIYYQQQSVFSLKEIDSIFQIFSNDGKNISGTYEVYNWFRIFISFYLHITHIEIMFINEKIQMKLQTFLSDQVFYLIMISQYESNYQFMKFTTYFRIQAPIQFDQNDLKSFNNCQTGINYYYAIETNNCKKYIDLEEIKVISHKNKFDRNSLYKNKDEFQNIGEIIQGQLFANISHPNNFPYLEDYDLEQQIINRDLFVLWKYQSHSICMKNYFGQNCRSYFRQCLVAPNNNECIQCQEGYILINSRCKKCQRGCLICALKRWKQICILPKDNYYTNVQGLAKICKCELCNNEGFCVTQQQMNQFIEQSLSRKFLFQNCQIWEYFILDQQQCILFQKDKQLQLFYYLPYSEQKYYSLNKLQFVILQNLQIYGPSLLLNKILQNYYLVVQIIASFDQYQTAQLMDGANYHLNRYNLKCKQTKFNKIGQTICKEFINANNSKCTNIPCIYQLEINNVTYYTGSQSYIVYNNFQYLSINDLLNSIKEVGIQFYLVKIDISFVQLVELDFWECVQRIDFHNNNQTNIYQSIMEVSLQFPQKLKYSSHKIILSIIADKITLSYLYININLYLLLNVNTILINTITINVQRKLKLQVIKGQKLIISKVKIIGQTVFLIDNLQTVEINGLWSFDESSIQFQFNNINQVSIYNSHLYSNNINEDSQINFYNVYNVKFNEVVIEFFKLTSQCLINLLTTNSLELNKFTLAGDVINDSHLIIIDETLYVNISNFNCYIERIINSMIISINSLSVYINMFNQQSGNMINSTQLHIQSFELHLIHYRTNTSITHLRQLINIFTSILMIEVLELNQLLNVHQEKQGSFLQGYLLNFQAEEYSVVSLLVIQGVDLINFGLLYIKSKAQFVIYKMKIESIFYLNNFDNKFITFKEYSSNPELIISYLILDKIIIENQIQNMFNLIEIINYAFVRINQIYINKINSNSSANQAYIFYVDSQLLKLNYLQVSDCRKTNFMNLVSQEIHIYNVQYDNNNQVRDFIIFNIHNNKTNFLVIKNSRFQLLQQLILNVITSKRLQILIKNISISYSISFQFKFEGFHLEVTIKNIKINYLEEKRYKFNIKYRLFIINYAKIAFNNLIGQNLRQPLVWFWCSPLVIIQKSYLINTDLQDDVFLIKVSNSLLILENLRVKNIQNCQGLLSIDDSQEMSLYTTNIFVQNSFNMSYVFFIETKVNQTRLEFNDIQLQNLTSTNIFHQKSNQSQLQLVSAKTFFLINMDQIQIDRNINNLVLNNSIFSDIINISLEQKNLKLYNSEIQFNHTLLVQQIQIEKSLIFDQLKMEIISQNQFSFSIGFNKHNYLHSIKLNDSDENKIQFHVRFPNQPNDKQYFYIPSGFRFQDYKRLNLQQLQYQQIYQGFYLVAQGIIYGQSKYTLQCIQQQYYNDMLMEYITTLKHLTISDGINEINEILFIINPYNNNYTVIKVICSVNDNQSIQLQYNVRAFPCQFGEYLYRNQCLECNISESLYSVSYNSTKCNYIDYSKIKSVKKGLLQLQQSHWRYKFSSNIIEFCDSDYCIGGWIPGDQSCVKTRVGALCIECDLYNTRGDGHFTKSNYQCLQCKGIDMKFILQLLFAILWQIVIISFGYYSNYKLSQQYLMYKVGFKQFYQILYRQSIDQPSIYIKIYANYVFMLYIIKSNLDLIGQIFINNINIINNPNLVIQSQLDCLLSQYLDQDIIYLQYFYVIFQIFFILSLILTIYLILVFIKLQKFQLSFIIYGVEKILIYNLKIIINISSKLLSYKLLSGQKWIRQNLNYLYYSNNQNQMFHYIIPISTILFVFPLMFPVLMSKIHFFNRSAKRIYAIYYQEFKPKLFYWEYQIRYTKYLIIIFQIFDDKSFAYIDVIILALIIIQSNFKPYYLSNLNQFELNMFLTYPIQLNIIIFSNYKDYFIIFFNLFNLGYFISKFIYSYYYINFSKIIQLKFDITTRLKWLRKFSDLNRDERILRNKQNLIYLTRTQILKKLNPTISITSHQKSAIYDREIELSNILLDKASQRIYPTRQEQ